MDKNAIVVDNLSVYYETFWLVIDHFELKQGYVMGLIGKNGAGKTTFIDAILELVVRNSGKIEILGKDFTKNSVEIKERIAYVNDSFVYPGNMNAITLAEQVGCFYKNFDITYYKSLCSRFGIDLKQEFKSLSKGTQAKLSLVFALGYHADLLILDEPTANLDPVSRHEVLDLLYEVMQEESKTILFSTHITSDLDKIADYITFIDNGKLEFTCSINELQEENQIITVDGDIPQEIMQYLRGIRKTEKGYSALCVKASLFKNFKNIHFEKASIEDLMYYWDIKYE